MFSYFSKPSNKMDSISSDTVYQCKDNKLGVNIIYDCFSNRGGKALWLRQADRLWYLTDPIAMFFYKTIDGDYIYTQSVIAFYSNKTYAEIEYHMMSMKNVRVSYYNGEISIKYTDNFISKYDITEENWVEPMKISQIITKLKIEDDKNNI